MNSFVLNILASVGIGYLLVELFELLFKGYKLIRLYIKLRKPGTYKFYKKNGSPFLDSSFYTITISEFKNGWVKYACDIEDGKNKVLESKLINLVFRINNEKNSI